MTLMLGRAPDGLPIYLRGAAPTGAKVGEATADVGPTGEIVARFATLNVIDADNDVTVSGAVGRGQDVLVSAYGHKSWDGALPIGKGRVTEEGSALILRGNLFLDTFGGMETFKTLRAVGAQQEYSYGFRIPVGGTEYGTFEGKQVRFLKRLSIFEVSPVLKGAGVGTGTLQLNELDLEVAHAARENDLALLRLAGFGAPAKALATIDGHPIRLVHRKV